MAGLTVHFEVLNQLNTPTLYADTLVNRPTPSIVGRIFFRTDSPFGIYRDTGSSWDLIANPDTTGISGSGVAGQVPYFTGATTIGGTNNLFWDSANNRLGIGTATPGVPLDVHGTGTQLQLNGTGTNNSFAVFQNSGTGKWRIGNNYSTGTNYFSIYDTTNAVETIKITPGATNVLTFTGSFGINTTPTTYIFDNTGNLNATYTLTGIAAATTIVNNRLQSLYTFNSGITRTTIADIGTSIISTMTFSGAFTKSNDGQMNNLAANLTFALSGNFTQNQPATYTQSPTVIQVGANFSGAFSVSHFSGTRLAPWISATPSTITNAYQLAINNLSGFSAASLSPTYTNRWGIYQDGASDNNYFAGKLLLGTTTVGTYALSINGTTLHSGQTDFADAVNITTGTTTGTKIATATTQKIGFWNVAPIVQPTTATASATFVANAGTAINTLSTFDGYKIDQVVKALRNAGILA